MSARVDAEPRLAEIVGVLALAQDGAFGQPAESQLRASVLSLELASELAVAEADREAVFWCTPLRYLGCTGHAHEVAALFGDDIEMRARSLLADQANPVDMLREIVTGAGRHRPPLARARTVLAALAGGRKGAEMNFRTGCEVGEALARRLGVPARARDALRFTFERFNGRGFPDSVTGQAIPLAMRIAHVACDAEILARMHGTGDALATIQRRAGKAYDPDVAAVFVGCGERLLGDLDVGDPWERWLAAEPAVDDAHATVDTEIALEVLADFADLKSPYTGGHSRGVAALAHAAGVVVGFTADQAAALRAAALVHDLGRVAVPNSIWDKPGPLTHGERDRVQTHPLRTEQLLARSATLGPLVSTAGAHHERTDGTGYHRRAKGGALSLAARLLAAADRYQAMTEQRAHRPGLTPDQAATELREETRNGGLDPDAAEAVLAGAGHVTQAGPPDNLSARELEVLRLVARGLTTKQIAAQLSIATKTADRHIQNLYAKAGVSTRGAAALYAIERGLT